MSDKALRDEVRPFIEVFHVSMNPCATHSVRLVVGNQSFDFAVQSTEEVSQWFAEQLGKALANMIELISPDCSLPIDAPDVPSLIADWKRLTARVEELEAENAKLRELNNGHCERIAKQSDLLSKRAETTQHGPQQTITPITNAGPVVSTADGI